MFRKTGSWKRGSLILTEGIIKDSEQRQKCTGSANDSHSIRGKKWTFLLINQVPPLGRVKITNMDFLSSTNQCFGIVIVAAFTTNGLSPDLISLAQPGGLEGGNSQAPENQARSHYLWIDVGGIIG